MLEQEKQRGDLAEEARTAVEEAMAHLTIDHHEQLNLVERRAAEELEEARAMFEAEKQRGDRAVEARTALEEARAHLLAQLQKKLQQHMDIKFPRAEQWMPSRALHAALIARKPRFHSPYPACRPGASGVTCTMASSINQPLNFQYVSDVDTALPWKPPTPRTSPPTPYVLPSTSSQLLTPRPLRLRHRSRTAPPPRAHRTRSPPPTRTCSPTSAAPGSLRGPTPPGSS
eukprot:gnl/TRDRNA2_/TRDRNA2_161913_c2_seq1.p1 gnl/TRDRNA2_/TRDRNA2_161913_c2~~gnl/TRDRNA2_/TRDRNA2_161913_c2_seq1.p1  ORF type:complete len:229 (-),score=31.80 gnl/TRDRNA2_/TRDRNA2_161913_c2_seq1:223-909(-)